MDNRHPTLIAAVLELLLSWRIVCEIMVVSSRPLYAVKTPNIPKRSSHMEDCCFYPITNHRGVLSVHPSIQSQ